MRELDRLMLTMARQETARENVEEFPLPVVEDWDELVGRSERMAELIDRHLDFESKLQGRELRPMSLCPEQKVSLVADLSVV